MTIIPNKTTDGAVDISQKGNGNFRMMNQPYWLITFSECKAGNCSGM